MTLEQAIETVEWIYCNGHESIIEAAAMNLKAYKHCIEVRHEVNRMQDPVAGNKK
jgi:hypothetical protein